MKIFSIETSCDETAVAVLKVTETKSGVEFQILSNQIASQAKIHAPFGGVVPNLAKREHKKNLPLLLKRTLKESGILKPDIVAVTYGPGLEPALWTGINFAKELSKQWNAPLVPVNHLEGHIYSGLMQKSKFKIQNFGIFPMLTLIVSGGHTELVLSKKHLDYKILGETKDDAAGESFDKVARMLGLGYPGGPLLSRIAERGNPAAVIFPRPMMHSKDLNFSFSGLKTAVLYHIKELKRMDQGTKADIAASFQAAVVDVLVRKTLEAVKRLRPKTVAIGGGVAANEALRKELSKKLRALNEQLNFLLPEKIFTGDNAAMIATAAYFRFKAGKFQKNPEALKAEGGLKLSKA